MKVFDELHIEEAPMSDSTQSPMLQLTTQIVAAHVANNQTAPDALPDLIKSVYQSLSSASEINIAPEQHPAQVPAVPVKRSVFPDYLVCLEDGRKLKMLKRHLQISFNMTPADYRAKWGLPADYPLVAPNYASKRAEMARSIGLGRRSSSEPKVTIGPARRAKGSRG